MRRLHLNRRQNIRREGQNYQINPVHPSIPSVPLRPLPEPPKDSIVIPPPHSNGDGHGDCIHTAKFHHPTKFTDYGNHPYVVDINKATLQNSNFRTTIWTGEYLQVTLMCIPAGEDIGLELHPDTDQFLRIEDGQGLVQMGETKDKLHFRQAVFNDSAVFVPAGTWHNIVNVGSIPLKLYSIYAPPHHPHGTVHPTKAIAEKMGD